MGLVYALDGFGRLAWFALALLGFLIWWPLGLLTFLFFFGRFAMNCWGYSGPDRWQRKMDRLRDKFERLQAGGGRFGGDDRGRDRWHGGRGTGNHAFDQYREETLRRLEAEQREFEEFLGKLRFAKDKAEFDQFMAERAGRGDFAPPARE